MKFATCNCPVGMKYHALNCPIQPGQPQNLPDWISAARRRRSVGVGTGRTPLRSVQKESKQ